VAQGTSWIVSLDLRLRGLAEGPTDPIGAGFPDGTVEVCPTRQITRIGGTGPVVVLPG
jgi:hypothetical protein